MESTRDLFGQVALRRGFITREQLAEALRLQGRRPDGTPKLLGLILLDQGIITTSQLIEVLREVRSLTTQSWMRRAEPLPRLREKAS